MNMTLSEVLPDARRLSILEKLQLIQLLAADLDISPLEPFKTYDYRIDTMILVRLKF
jgi:hypothetical protein